VYAAGLDSPWILAKHSRERKIPFSADDGYGTIKRRSSDRETRHDQHNAEPSPLFLPTSEANLVQPTVGDKSVTL